MQRRQFLSSAAMAFAAPSVAARSAAGKPNIVFILADDLGYGDTGCYGSKQIRTPAIDQFAAEGLRFTDAYAGSTVCAPSRCSLMTGMHQGHAYIRGNHQPNVPLRKADTTVAELLQRAGYYTGMFGKWGLGEPYSTGRPSLKGFDGFFGYLDQVHAHNYWTDTLWDNETQIWLEGNFGGQKGLYSHDLIARRALEFLEKAGAKPFFLYAPFTIPHLMADPPDVGPYAKEKWSDEAKKYAAMVTRMDSDIAKIMATLKRKGFDENTLVIFSSDNGAPPLEANRRLKSNGQLRGFKRDLYEGGIREPFVARWPGKIIPGVTNQAVAFWDFLPTACEAAGMDAPAGIDGISFLPTLFGKPQKQKQHDYFYWEFHEGAFAQAVRSGVWKAVRSAPGRSLEIYNLREDTSEQHDLARQHPEIVTRMEQFIKAAHAPSAIWPVSNKPPSRKA